MMIDLGSHRSGGPMYIMESAATSVDCSGQIPLRRSFRSLVHRLVPACCSSTPAVSDDSPSPSNSGSSTPPTTTSTVTGTFFGYRKGRVSFCLQDDARSGGALLLLVEFAVHTAFLAREMQHGILRIALECDGRAHHSCPLFSVPVWSLYCNGRKVGFAVRRSLSQRDVAVLKVMQSVSVGAGVLPDGDLMYLRASFERVRSGSADSESFHMMNPGGSSGQELSIFFLRSS